MRLQEACVRFNKLAGIRFEELFSQNDMNMIIINKGKTGQLLELALGMHLSSTNRDLWRDFLNFPYFTGFSAH